MFVVLFTGLVVYSIDIKILSDYERKRDKADRLLEKRKQDVYSQIPQVKEIEDEIVAKLAKAFPAIMILICVGLMIGA